MNFFLHAQAAFTLHDDEILSLNEFDNKNPELFSDSDSLSSHDFVARWKILQNKNAKSSSNISCSSDFHLSGSSSLLPTVSSTSAKVKTGGSKNAKRKRLTNITGRQRGMLAWERDQNTGLFPSDVVYGGEGWPPPFRKLVQQMREFLQSETGLKDNWDCEDGSMLRKYYCLKFQIPVKSFCFVYIKTYT